MAGQVYREEALEGQKGREDREARFDGHQPETKPVKRGENALGERIGPAGGWTELSKLRLGRGREFRKVCLALALWRRLGLHALLGERIEPGRERMARAEVASVGTVGKFCGQGSELVIPENG